jgi:hypothetical protein
MVMNSPWGRVQWLRREPEEWPSFPGKYGMASMASDDAPRSGRGGDSLRPRAKAPTERPFDMWLQKQLHAMYDEIAGEPLPSDLLGLIDNDAAKTGEQKKSEPGKGKK